MSLNQLDLKGRSASVALFLFISFGLSSLSFGFPAPQQDTTRTDRPVLKQPVYVTTRLATEKPVIDGKLDDECWKHGNWAGDYNQYIPNEGAKPTFPTEHNIQYDDRNLYIAFRAYDPEPDKIHRYAGVRDDIVGDMVGVNFDSYRDYRTGFEFTITAWGQKVDLVLFNPTNWDFNWNAVWKGKVGMEDSAWVAEIEVPLSQLRYSNKDEQVWGLHTWRWIDRLQEESNWERQTKTGPGMLYNYGEFIGLRGLKKSRRLEIQPFVLGDLKTMKEIPGDPYTKNGRNWGGNAGLDAKIGVSSNFTIDLTVNPDFGQVESDPSVMNLTAFETFYEEKRPFFLEGLTIFDYKFDNQTLFYSRRIGHSPSRTVDAGSHTFVKNPDMTTILSAAKFSGTDSKGLSVGLIQSVTANEYARITDIYGNESKQIVEPLTNYLVGRIQKGYNAGNTIIGGMFTSTNRFINDEELEFLPTDAFTGGIDLLHHWKDKKFFVNAKISGSYIKGSPESIKILQESPAHYFQRPGADYVGYDITRTNLSGLGGKIQVGKGSGGHWKYSAALSWLTPGFDLNDLGYMKSADEIENQNEIEYFITKPVSVFRTLSVSFEQRNSWTFNGTSLGSDGELGFKADFANQWKFEAEAAYHSSDIDTRLLRGGYDVRMPANTEIALGLQTDPSKKFIAHAEYQYMKGADNSATAWTFLPGISVRPISILKLGINAEYEENMDELQYVATKNTAESGKRYILGTINQKTLGLTFRVDLNLSPEFSIQYYGSPFISKGRYSELKKITNPEAGNYEDRFAVYQNALFVDGKYLLPDYDGGFPVMLEIENPDFNFHQFRSNLVAKWEYRLGSFIYLVWSGERTGNNIFSNASFGDSYRYLRKVYPNNIFLIKLNYWFSL
ncbi:MAG: carbohydrate binding family 9 domain-containing protein [Bacteroidales bacterium]|jgi:hypothetical protein|nr:carbohydrate binding family 9 domain-containing protein [Bacteroidales bacterium]